eukprot:4800002-Prymnesium_polylepis.1
MLLDAAVDALAANDKPLTIVYACNDMNVPCAHAKQVEALEPGKRPKISFKDATSDTTTAPIAPITQLPEIFAGHSASHMALQGLLQAALAAHTPTPAGALAIAT